MRENEPPEVAAAGAGCRGFDIKITNLDGDPGAELVAEFAGEASATTSCFPARTRGS